MTQPRAWYGQLLGRGDSSWATARSPLAAIRGPMCSSRAVRRARPMTVKR